MAEVDEWDQLALEIPGGPGTVKVKRRRRGLPVTKCSQCKKDILQPWLSGTGEGFTGTGLRLKLDPVSRVGGDYFIVGKTAHLRLPEHLHPSFEFYVEHDCIAGMPYKP